MLKGSVLSNFKKINMFQSTIITPYLGDSTI